MLLVSNKSISDWFKLNENFLLFSYWDKSHLLRLKIISSLFICSDIEFKTNEKPLLIVFILYLFLQTILNIKRSWLLVLTFSVSLLGLEPFFLCLLELFMESYSINAGEDNITSALNDMVKQVISDSKRHSKEVIIGLNSQQTSNINNDYKYNFKISNKRYSDFVNTCSILGLNANECLRKQIMLYIHNNKCKN